jgi:outer membrane protein assembly factor BamB
VSYPVIANGRVFLSMVEKGQPAVSAYNLEDGTLVWGPLFESQVNSLTYEGGRLFGEDRNGLVQAWDAATGIVLWKASLRAIDGQTGFDQQFPLAQGGLLYASGYGDAETVYAFGELTGALRWHTKVGASGNPITIGGGAVFLTGACQSVIAIDALTGTPSTVHSTTCSGAGGGMPAYYRGDLWVADPKGSIVVDTTGRQVGTFPMGAAPAFHNGVAFYQTGNLIAVDLETGATKWTFEAPNLCAPPAVAGAGGQVFVGSSDGHIYEVDEETGRQISVANAGFGTTGRCEPMALAAGRLLFADGNGVTAY